MQTKIRVNIIGAGNVATHLSKALFTAGIEIVSVFSRDFINARALSHQFGAKAVDAIEDVDDNVDLNIVTVKDEAIGLAALKLPKNIPVVHTSGSASIYVFEGFNSYGVLYPLQTFSKQRALDIAAIPFLIEGNSIEFESWILNFASTYLSENVHSADSKKRGQIHIAAVIACNFTTQLLQESDNILQQVDLDISLLHPLIKETLEKVIELGPKEALTGPAKRGDLETIEKHIKQINDEELRELYKRLSNRIIANI